MDSLHAMRCLTSIYRNVTLFSFLFSTENRLRFWSHFYPYGQNWYLVYRITTCFCCRWQTLTALVVKVVSRTSHHASIVIERFRLIEDKRLFTRLSIIFYTFKYWVRKEWNVILMLIWDFMHLFSTLMVSFKLNSHRIYFLAYHHTFTVATGIAFHIGSRDIIVQTLITWHANKYVDST